MRIVSLRMRLAAFATLAMTLVIAERTVSVFRLHADNLAAAESHVLELLDRGVGHYEQTLATVQAVLLTLASNDRLLPRDMTPAAGSAAQGKDDGSASAAEPPDPSMTPGDPEACAPLRAVVNAFPTIESLALVAPNGIVRCGTAPGSAGLDLSARDHVEIALRGIAHIEPIQRSYVTAQPSIYAAQPVIGANGEGVLGVIVARISLSELFPHGVLGMLGTGTQAVLVSPAGTVMMSYPDNAFVQGSDISHAPAVARALSRTRGTLIAEGADGVPRVYAFTRLSETNMHLLAGVDEAIVMAPVERATLTAGITMLVVGLIVLLGLWIAGEKLIVAPIQALADRLVRFGRGDREALNVDILVSELQPLAVAFEAMAGELTRRESALRNANQRLNSLASLDSLTGIANRRSFDAVFALHWNTSQYLAVLILDIDNFKKFNDLYGHKEGDHCLRRIAQMLASMVRGADTVARIGGEEFAVLMPDTQIGTAMEVAERLRRGVEELAIPHAATSRDYVTTSIGCAACRPAPGLAPADLFVAADRALYAAKDAGRNAVHAAAELVPPPPMEGAGARPPPVLDGTGG